MEIYIGNIIEVNVWRKYLNSSLNIKFNNVDKNNKNN